MIRFGLSAVVLAATVSVGHSATIQNGSFESHAYWSSAELSAGSTALAGWTVGSGMVDLIRSPFWWVAADGNYSLDMNGRSAGSIWQDVAGLEVGASYVVSFNFAANWNLRNAQPLKRLSVSAGGTSAIYEFLTSGQTAQDMDWTEQAFAFTATQSTERLTFSSLVPGAGGAALDNVRIDLAGPAPAAVPLPPTIALLAVAIGGLGWLRRRTGTAA